MTDELDLSLVPGAMEHTLRREIFDGLVEFEEAPVGWLTKAGEPRQKPWRAYFWTPTGGERVRFPSTTTLLDAICPKDGIPPWSEARGIEGAVEAVRRGLIGPDMTAADAVDMVRRAKLGADAVKLEAANRGLNVHALNEGYKLTGQGPKLADHPKHHHGFIQAWTRFTLAFDPEPVAIEQLVVHPEDGYAGRLDERAIVDKQLTTIDYKTQENAGIYRGAHLQVNLYERGEIRCGGEPAERRIVVVFAANGKFRVMDAALEDEQVDAALNYYRAVRPIDSACESANRAEKKARQAVPA